MHYSDKRILFVSALDLWGGDNKPLRAPGKTIDFYASTVDNVHILGISKNILNYQNYKNVKSVCFLNFMDHRKFQILRYILLNYVSVVVMTICCFRLCLKYRITHIYGYEVHGIVASYFASKFLGIKLISRFQGTVLNQKRDNLRNSLNFIIYFIHYLAFKLPCYKAVITDDGTFADDIFRKYNNSEFIFLRNGVNRPKKINGAEAINTATGLKLPERYVCCCSRLVRWKKVERVLLTLRNSSNLNIPLVIVGDGPDRERLNKIASQTGVKVYFTGHVSQETSYNIIGNSLVLLSFYDLSNLGNPVLEALDNGVPIVTLNNGNTKSMIQNGVNGILLEHWTASVASTALNRLISDTSLYQRIATGCREFSHANFLTWPERLRKEIQFLNL